MKLLDAQATAQALPWTALLAELQLVCREHRGGALLAPERMVLPLAEDGSLLLMPAISAGISITKLVTVHPHNRARGLPTITGEVVVMDSCSGERLLLLDGPTVTARRTAAVSLLALQYLAVGSPGEVLIVGAGVQALAHAEALRVLHPKARLFMQQRGQALPERSWDLIITATTSREPVLPVGLGTGALVIGVGAFRPDMVELPPALIRAAQVFVDDPAGAQAEAGDLLAAGLSEAQASLEDLVFGAVRVEHGRTRVFKSVGCARWDLAAARVAVRHA